MGHKFNPAKLDKLENPDRLTYEDPEIIWPLFGMPPPTRLVDLGAGTGFFTRRFAAKMPGGRVFACDIEQAMLDYLRQQLTDELADRVRTVLVEESVIALSDGEADAVFMANLHHELEDGAASCAEARRVLRPGGRAVVMDWLDRRTPHGPPEDHRVSAQRIVGDLTAAGFTNVTLHDKLPEHHLVTADKA